MSEEINLKNIEIKSFRGIKNFNIDFNKKSLVLVGENGSGKSSIVNAFEYLFTGKIESLSGKQAINHDKSLVHIGDNAQDLLVEAKFNNLTVKRTIDDLKYPSELENLINDFKNGSFLLNRKKLLTFIETTPVKRYESITSLIGFNELDKIEDTLNKTQKRFKTKLKNKNEELTKKIEFITSELECNQDEIYDKLNEKLSKNDLDNINEFTNLKKYLEEISLNDIEKNNQLSKLINLLDLDIITLNDDFEKLLNDYTEATLYELKSTSNLLDILNKSEIYISEEKPKKCPVCQKDMNIEQVLKYITRNKKDLNENEITLTNWKNSFNEFIMKLHKLNTNLQTIRNALSDFKEYDSNFDLNDLINDLYQLSRFEIPLSEIDSNSLIKLDNEFNELKNKIQKDYEKLNDEENFNDLTKIYEIIINLSQLKELEEELRIIQNQFEASETTYQLFKEKKQKALQAIIDEIEQLVNDYYNFIHSDEEFNSPEINVPKSTGISLNLKFNDITADPRTYSSEGHLDSLGLCIFLAFVKEFNKYNLVILDDIISTVDLNHKERIAMLILSEFKDYQFIITTHSNLWFRQLKNYVNNYKLGPNYIFAEIKSLDPQTGPVLTKNMFSKELIEKYIELGDAFAAGNAIRRYLENVFESVCRVNQIPLPLKQHYMVDDYFKVIRPYFLDSRLFNSSPEIKEYYEEVFNILNSSRYMGNLLSHDDDSNLDVTINEVEKFRDAVYLFEKSMTCTENHNSYLKFNIDYKYATCTNPRCATKISFKNNN